MRTHIKHHSGQPPDRRLRQRDRAGSARPGDAAASDRAAIPANAAPAARPRTGSTTAPDGTTTGQSREPLGDKLAKSDGVLCPPSGVDPDMHAPAPSTNGAMPVIPPPGSPGGDPTVRPK